MDFRVTKQGTVWSFEPLTDAAKEFTATLGLEGWQWLGNTFNLDARLANNLLFGLVEEEGFEIELA